MTERSDRLEEIFHGAKDLASEEERQDYLRRMCEGDTEVSAKVEALLRASEESDQVYQCLDSNTVLDSGNQLSEKPGEQIGRYKLLQKIGEGGMGVVYMAEQRDPVIRKVALKIIKLGMDTKQVVARFEAERQALALMDHPNIAKILDGGSTTSGRVYFCLDLVHGKPITQFCDQRNLNTIERLNLFVDVCEAVQHAHQKGIIHRDLKPSNILVTLNGEKAIPKIIDFGIAKATQQRLTEKTFFTRFQQFIGTPAYMSPEQADLSEFDIDTRSDIYSLGVLLYELLTGFTPFETKDLLSAGYDQISKMLMEHEPLKPSIRLSCLTGDELKTTAQHRQCEPDTLGNLVRGELDWIVLKALEKDRNRRYESPTAFAQDIGRYLHNEPVSAASPSVVYTLKKFAKRNRTALVTASAFALILILSTIVSGVFAFREHQARLDKTEAEKTAQTLRIRAEENERQALALAEQRRKENYALDMFVADIAVGKSRLDIARDRLNRHIPVGSEKDLRGLEWSYLWSNSQGDELLTVTNCNEWIEAVKVSPDSKFLAHSTPSSTTIRKAHSPYEVITHLPTGSMSLSFPESSEILVTANESEVTVWNTITWEKEKVIANASYPAILSPDGRWLATGQPDHIQLWQTKTWSVVTNLPVDLYTGTWWGGDDMLEFSSDSKTLIYPKGASPDHFIFWDLEKLQENIERSRIASGGLGLALSPNRQQLLRSFGDVQLYDLNTGTNVVLDIPRGATEIEFSVDGRYLVTADGQRRITVCDGSTFEILRTLKGHTDEIWALDIFPNSRTIVSGGHDGAVKIWEIEAEKTNGAISTVPLLAAGFQSNDSRLIALDEHGYLKSFDPGTIASEGDLGRPVNSRDQIDSKRFDQQLIHLSADARLVALGLRSGTVLLWDVVQKQEYDQITLEHETAVDVVCFHPTDASILAIADSKGRVRLWNTDRKELILEYSRPFPRVRALTFSPNGETLGIATDRNKTIVSDDGDFVLWNWKDDQVSARLPGVYLCASFSHDGELLATGGYGETKIWNGRTFDLVQTLIGHNQAVPGVQFSPDAKSLITASSDFSIKFWNATTWTEMVHISTSIHRPKVWIAPDSRSLFVGPTLLINSIHLPSDAESPVLKANMVEPLNHRFNPIK